MCGELVAGYAFVARVAFFNVRRAFEQEVLVLLGLDNLSVTIIADCIVVLALGALRTAADELVATSNHAVGFGEAAVGTNVMHQRRARAYPRAEPRVVWAFDLEVVEHGDENPTAGPCDELCKRTSIAENPCGEVERCSANGTRPLRVLVGTPNDHVEIQVEAWPAKGVVAGACRDGEVKGSATDAAQEVIVDLGDVVESLPVDGPRHLALLGGSVVC